MIQQECGDDRENWQRGTVMKPFNFKSKRLEGFCVLLLLGGVFYVIDCLVVIAFNRHPEVPWFERGIYAGSPAGFFWTAGTILCALGYLVFGKDKKSRSY